MGTTTPAVIDLPADALEGVPRDELMVRLCPEHRVSLCDHPSNGEALWCPRGHGVLPAPYPNSRGRTVETGGTGWLTWNRSEGFGGGWIEDADGRRMGRANFKEEPMGRGGARVRISEERKAEIVRGFVEGVQHTEQAKKWGIAQGTFSRIIRESGATPKPARPASLVPKAAPAPQKAKKAKRPDRQVEPSKALVVQRPAGITLGLSAVPVPPEVIQRLEGRRDQLVDELLDVQQALSSAQLVGILTARGARGPAKSRKSTT